MRLQDVAAYHKVVELYEFLSSALESPTVAVEPWGPPVIPVPPGMVVAIDALMNAMRGDRKSGDHPPRMLVGWLLRDRAGVFHPWDSDLAQACNLLMLAKEALDM